MSLAGRLRPAGATSLVAALLASPAGCTDVDECDPTVDVCDSVEGTELYDGALSVDEVRWQCCDPELNEACGSAWYWYDVITVGLPASTEVEITEASDAGSGSAWSETHLLESQATDPDGWWDNPYIELEVADTDDCASLADCSDRHEAGSSTLFPCTEAWTEEKMTWTVSVFAEGNPDRVHCVTWGAEATDAEGCEVWTVVP